MQRHELNDCVMNGHNKTTLLISYRQKEDLLHKLHQVLYRKQYDALQQTPQILEVIRGNSSTGLPSQNFSKPRSSTT